MNRSMVTTGRRGFTLVEAAVAIVVIGLGIVALLGAMGAGARNVHASEQTTRGVMLAQEVREWTSTLTYEQLTAMGGNTYSPPRDGRGQPFNDFQYWAQTIELTWLDPKDFSQTLSPGASDLVEVWVTISYQDQPVYRTSWLVTGR